ncbi:collagen alpha-1(III) chain-like [Corvus hawaiiensis]|uniref:collagen alpha-1(III) chain-like n=1 Tax=Corvus hawaiiensis TaxID=134902 RepID=UPI0020188631|nr:collagen alpha-1(III) chain-like [Corvus hawaiiensis]
MRERRDTRGGSHGKLRARGGPAGSYLPSGAPGKAGSRGGSAAASPPRPPSSCAPRPLRDRESPGIWEFWGKSPGKSLSTPRCFIPKMLGARSEFPESGNSHGEAENARNNPGKSGKRNVTFLITAIRVFSSPSLVPLRAARISCDICERDPGAGIRDPGSGTRDDHRDHRDHRSGIGKLEAAPGSPAGSGSPSGTSVERRSLFSPAGGSSRHRRGAPGSRQDPGRIDPGRIPAGSRQDSQAAEAGWRSRAERSPGRERERSRERIHPFPGPGLDVGERKRGGRAFPCPNPSASSQIPAFYPKSQRFILNPSVLS